MAEPVEIVSFAKLPRLLMFPKPYTERKYTVLSPSNSSAISPPEGPVQALLPAIQTTPPLAIPKLLETRQGHTLPSLQTALAGISGPYNLSPVSISPLTTWGSEPAWEHKRSRQSVPSHVAPSPYPHVSPASCEDTLAVSPSASRKFPQEKHTQSDIICLTTSKTPPSTVKDPATSPPSPTDQTQVGKWAPLNPGPPPVAPIPTGTFKCRHPGCTAAPFRTQYLMK
jgi:hypothetical protein